MSEDMSRQDFIDVAWAAMDDRNDLDVSMTQLAEAAVDALGVLAMYRALKWAEAALAPFSQEPAERSGMAMIRAAIAAAEGRGDHG